MIRTRVLWVATLLVSAGCVTPKALSADPCSVMKESTDPATVIVLVDQSGSTLSDDPTDHVPSWEAAVGDLLPIEGGQRYAVAPFAGDRDLTWPDRTLSAPRIAG